MSASEQTPINRVATGGQAVVRSMLAEDIKRVYCVPGESYLAVIDALYDVRDDITQITCRHESGAAMMALAEAELSQRPAVCFVTRGPGATNASIAMHMAQQASVPLVLCIGQVASEFLGRDAFQEVDYERFYGDICKSVTNITELEQIPRAMRDAFALAREGRPGPVAVVFPEDILQRSGEIEFGITVTPQFTQAKTDATREALERLAEAEKPLIIAGGPLWTDEDCERLKKVAENLKVPVVTAFRRNDVVDNFSQCFAGYLGLNQGAGLEDVVREADFTLVLGPRLDEPTSQAFALPGFYTGNTGKQWWHIYPDFGALKNVPKASRRITTAPGDWLASASTMLPLKASPENVVHERWYAECHANFVAGLSADFAGKFDPGLLDLPRLMTELNELLPNDAIVTTDAGNFTLWPQRLRRYQRPGRLLAPINGAMGFGVPSAIAASLAYPERTVVGFVGDGGFMMTAMELATAIKYGARPIIIVFNNALYGTIDTHQQRLYPGREHGNELANPDFVSFAESFGAAAVRVTKVVDFANAFLQAKQLEELAVIELGLT